MTSELVGRSGELATVRSLISGARNSIGAALVVRGEPGIGKTALIEAATSGLADVTLIRSDGFEAESTIPFAGLHRVGLALRAEAGALSPRHRQALNVAFGIESGPPPDRFLVGLAMLALVAAASAHTPVVCLFDDAQWLDAESLAVLGFVARRLTAESSVLLFSARDTGELDVALAGITSLQLGGLDTPSAIRLLQTVLPEDVDPYSTTQIAAATGGNPLALIDLARDLTRTQITDLTLSATPAPIGRQLEEHYLRQVHTMTGDEQTWLLIAAVESGEQRALIDGAARRLGVAPDSADAAVRRGLVALSDVSRSDVVVFRHPLVRSAVYGAAPAGRRRTVHTALAAEADHLGLADVGAWHAAEATIGVDPVVADRLADAAQRAARRGGLVSQARLLARAASLTPPGRVRHHRLLSAAEIAVAAGAAHLAGDLLDRMTVTELDPTHRGRSLSTRSMLALFVADPSVAHGPAQLLEAAALLAAEPERQQKALLQSFEIAMSVEREMKGTTLADLGRRLREGARGDGAPRSVVLEAASALVEAPYAEAVPVMRAAVDMLFAMDDDQLPEYGFVGIAFTVALFDIPSSLRYLTRLTEIARGNGALRMLDATLWVRAMLDCERGDQSSAALHMDQVRELRRAIGYGAENVVNVAYLAWTGTPLEQVEMIRDITRSMGFGGVYTSAQSTLANRDLAEGRYQLAFDRLQALLQEPFLHPTQLNLAPFVEAAARSGHHDDARYTADLLDTMASANDAPWLSGLAARSRALVTPDAEAEPFYLRAIELLDPVAVPVDTARAHLLYGEWLRRLKRRREAREQLRTALALFERINTLAFAERARSELIATGERVQERQTVAGVELAEREATVAKMAAAGATNAEIAASLFITTHTVDYHLRKVFQKLGITSRRQLTDRFDTRV